MDKKPSLAALALAGVERMRGRDHDFRGRVCALLLLLRPIARKYMKTRTVPTNVSSNLGKTAVVTAAIDNLRGVGAVKIGGVEWSARSADDTPIEKDAVVRVTKIEGVKVFVELVKEEVTK